MASKRKRMKLRNSAASELKDDLIDDVNDVKTKRKLRSQIQPDSRDKSQAESQANIDLMSLNDDCLQSILEEMSVQDLCSVSQTCKHLQMLAKSVFVRCYKEKQMTIEKISENDESIDLVYQPKDEEYIKCFGKYIQNITLGKSLQIKKQLSTLCKLYKSEMMPPIKVLKIDCWGRGLRTNTFETKRCKEFVEHVETLTIVSTKVNGNLNDCVLKHMPQLKRLTLWKELNEPDLDDEDDWMSRQYPNLEYFAWHLDRSLPIERINTFFAFNPNINHFSLTAKTQSTLNQLQNEAIRVDVLYFTFASNSNMAACFRDLQTLCAENLCRRLHLRFPDTVRRMLDRHLNELIFLSPYIEGLYFEKIDISDELAHIIIVCDRLKVLQLNIASNFELLSRSNSLEEMFAYWGVNTANFQSYYDALFRYAVYTPNLKKIYMRNNSQPFEKFDFSLLDTERLEWGGTNKLKIYFRTDETTFTGKFNDVERDHYSIEVLRVETEHVDNPLVTDYLTTVQLNQSTYEYFHSRRNGRRYWY